MKIWLDDERKAPDGFIHVKNNYELKTLLDENPETIEEMSFDWYLGSGQPDGLEVARWLAINYLERWPKKVRAHSQDKEKCREILRCDAHVRENLLDKHT